jgi:hypothetical protein
MTKKSDIRIIRKTKRVDFSFDGEYYTYEFRSDPSHGYAYIWKGQKKIYGPMRGDQTDEGIKVHSAIQKKLQPKKGTLTEL